MKNSIDNTNIGFRYPDAPLDAGVNSPPVPSLRMLVNEPVWREVCAYCGYERADKLGCCGEVHFINQPECPECGDHVDRLDGVTGCGLEYQIFKCCNCGFVSDPE